MVCICFSSGLLLVPVVLFLFSGGLCVGLSGLVLVLVGVFCSVVFFVSLHNGLL